MIKTVSKLLKNRFRIWTKIYFVCFYCVGKITFAFKLFCEPKLNKLINVIYQALTLYPALRGLQKLESNFVSLETYLMELERTECLKTIRN